MQVYIASDHGGFNYKAVITKYLQSKGIDVADVGAHTLDKLDDYPKYVSELANNIKSESDRGIVICRNGVGVSIAANRFKNIRCGLALSASHIKSAVNDDNINVLSIAADYLTAEGIISIVDTFLTHTFSNDERHRRRLKELDNITND